MGGFWRRGHFSVVPAVSDRFSIWQVCQLEKPIGRGAPTLKWPLRRLWMGWGGVGFLVLFLVLLGERGVAESGGRGSVFQNVTANVAGVPTGNVAVDPSDPEWGGVDAKWKGYANPVVEMMIEIRSQPRVTGNIVIELFEKEAPISTENFLYYVFNGFYSDTFFHRVIEGVLVQGGGYTYGFETKPTRWSIRNEAANGLKNTRGTLSMARRSEVDSANSQFFINLRDNDFLNHREGGPEVFGYAVFGRVVDGMALIEKISKLPVKKVGPFENVPQYYPVVVKARVLNRVSGIKDRRVIRDEDIEKPLDLNF